MIKNYLLITFRSLMKSKIYIFINILGMSISIACCITAYYNWRFNDTFDRYHEKGATIYRVNSVRDFQGKSTAYGYVPVPLGGIVRDNIKDVESSTRYNNDYVNFRIGDEIFDNRIGYVDKEFFELFTFEFIGGNASAIADKSKMIISDEVALKFFGTEQAVGKPMTQIVEGKLREYEVGAVFRKPPINSSFSDGIYSSYENYLELETVLENGANWVYRASLFVQVKEKSRIPVIESQMKPLAAYNNKAREDFVISSFVLDPLEGMATRDEYSKRPGTWTRNASPLAAVLGCAVMAVFVLLIACFNLTNTTIAMSSRRLKEIGIRKVMGSRRGQLIAQFIGETWIVCFTSMLLGMLIADLFLVPAFNALWPYMKFTTNYFGEPDFLLLMIGVLFITGILAGSYPAFYISKFQPTSILKGKVKFGGTNYFTRTLLALQFGISLIAIVCSFAFIGNAEYQRDLDLGYNKSGVLFTWVENEDEYTALQSIMVQDPDVQSTAGAQHQLFSSGYSDPIKHDSKEIEVDILHIGDNYLDAAGLTLLAGRNFHRGSETDRRESVLVTEKLASQFGWKDPIGKEITWLDTVRFYVVGVVKDVYNNGVWREMDPIMFRCAAPADFRHLIVKTDASRIVAVNQYMESRWKEIFPNRKFASRYMDSTMVEANTVNINIVKMFVFLGIVAMMLSVTGLFTMVSLNIMKKMKEIGVRKVLGASVGNISLVINSEFGIILLMACFLGVAGGAWMSEMLMNSIWDFYQKATFMTMIGSSILLLVTSALTVSLKTYNTTKMNPVNVLRDE